jgi:hypothetical protein
VSYTENAVFASRSGSDPHVHRYYGFTGKPFQLNPDPQFFYASREKSARWLREYGLHRARASS